MRTVLDFREFVKWKLKAARYHIKRNKHLYLNNFAFVHINKTAGSSVRKALGIHGDHKTALEKIEWMGKKRWNKKFTFTIVRNPFGKVVSHYCYRIKTNQLNMRVDNVSFEEWIHLTYDRKDENYYDSHKMFMPQCDWISDKSGNVIVDYICRFESLREDFAYVCDKIGVDATLPQENATEHDHYSKYYNKYTKKIISRCFEKDIEKFGYRF